MLIYFQIENKKMTNCLFYKERNDCYIQKDFKKITRKIPKYLTFKLLLNY